jgi:uracil-DNA glycosylase
MLTGSARFSTAANGIFASKFARIDRLTPFQTRPTAIPSIKPMPQPLEPPAAALSILLSHLRRSGIEFLPMADAARVAEWVTQGTDSSAMTAVAQPIHDAPAIPNPSAMNAASVAVPPAVAAVAPLRTPSPTSRLASAPPSHPVSMPKAEPYSLPLVPLDQRQVLLTAIAQRVSGCTRCEVLACQRKTTVPGEGNPGARVCFVGEAPGADEDASGKPFVGRAGQLLTKMIEACTFSREQVFILNTIKCRPPNNRNPEHGEIENCREYLTEQLEIIQPEYIVCLGVVAAQTLLHTKLSVGRLRGQFHAYRESKVIVTYHPSYLLREPAVKKAAWADLQFMLRDMGITLPQK